MDVDRSLTTGEIAKLCDVSFRTVIRWIERGWLKGYKLPGRGDNRVRVGELRAFLVEHRMPVPRRLERHDRRVLVVGDARLTAGAVARALRRAGFETRVAAGPLQAGSLAESFRPAVVTLDLDIPGLGGVDAVRFLRSCESLRGLRILALSRRKLREALAAGADEVVGKPFETRDIVARVTRLAEPA